MRQKGVVMAKMRWVSYGLKGEHNSEKCPATAENRAGRGGSGKKREMCVVGAGFLSDRVLDIT